MPAVLVNGVPDTTALWGPVREHLTREDLITAAPPGFGSPVPDGFGATKEEYVAWLVGELEAGRDWNGTYLEGMLDYAAEDEALASRE